jgi:hypothetical protein
MFRKSLLTGLMIIAVGGLAATATASESAAAATPATACAVSTVIEITHFAFNPTSVFPGQSSTATLTARNCTNVSQQTSETWSGRFVSATGTGLPKGCPVIDPIALSVDFAPLGTNSTSVGYLVPQSCTATQLIVTVDIHGTTGILYAQGTAVLNIVQ